MEAGFKAYAQTVKHHSLLLASLQKKIDTLEEANNKKGVAIENLVKENTNKADQIKELLESNRRKDARLEALEIRMDALQETVGVSEENCSVDGLLNDLEELELSVRAQARAAREQLTEKEKKKVDQQLLKAATKGNASDVQVLASRGANVNVISGAFTLSTPAIMSAAREGHQEVVEVLIAGGANINLTNKVNETAVFAATEYNHPPVITALIKAGAQLSIVSSNHNGTALDFATKKGFLELIELLEAAGAKRVGDL